MPRTSKLSKKSNPVKKANEKIHKKNSNSNIDAVDIVAKNDHFNIIDILLMDHTYLKDCIDLLQDEEVDLKAKFKHAKGFLDALEKHSTGEKKALYTPLLEVEDLRPRILESIIEHGIVDERVKKINKKLITMKGIDDEMEAELKVLSDLVEHHLEEEEDILFPKMKKEIETEILNQMGYQFMVLRQFTEKDLEAVPELQDEMEMISLEEIPVKNFMNITHEYFARI